MAKKHAEKKTIGFNKMRNRVIIGTLIGIIGAVILGLNDELELFGLAWFGVWFAGSMIYMAEITRRRKIRW